MEAKPKSPRVLIVYYSRSGNTATVARGLARASNADLEALTPTTNRRGLIGYLWSGFEGMSGREARIHPPNREPKNYDIVLIGTPTWGAAVSSPIRTYLNRFAGTLPDVGFFVTCGGRGAEQVLAQMQSISGKKPLATLALRERELEHRPSVYFAEFWESVLSGWESHAAHAAE